MIYFKHMSNMRHDIKIKRLISKYGIEGYGLYNLILESIVEGISTDSPLPDLQETCEDLAEFYNGNTAKIDEIVRFMISQGLFEVEELTGKILCMKIYKFLEQSQTRSKAIRELIGKYKTATNVCDKSDRIEENRIEENREEYKREECAHVVRFVRPSLEDISAYCQERKNRVDPQAWLDHYESNGWKVGKNAMKDWRAAVRTWERGDFGKPSTSSPSYSSTISLKPVTMTPEEREMYARTYQRGDK